MPPAQRPLAPVPQIRARLAAARSRWPQIELGDDDFDEFLARHPHAGEHLDDLFLACACARGDRAALAELDRSVLSLVPRWTARIEGVSADDVQQELRRKLLVGPPPRILDYDGRRALTAWLRVAATRCAIDLQRAHKPAESDALEDLWDAPDPELDLVKLRDRDAVRAVLHEAVAELPARDRSLLRLHYLDGMSLEKLAVMERVHRATVARWLGEARASVLERVRALLRERLRLTTEEGESLLRFVRSRLDASLRRALE
jgi:RNA polymerase sigma-70 factor (ECF subfamily)